LERKEIWQMKILVSACLLGANCRYDGGNNNRSHVIELLKDHILIPVCPEQLGGLSTPRPPVEWQGDRAMNNQGADCTMQFHRGAEEALRIAQLYGCKVAILKAKSPSCGNHQIYDGTFSGQLVNGAGGTARLLQKNGITVINETEVEAWIAGSNDQ